MELNKAKKDEMNEILDSRIFKETPTFREMFVNKHGRNPEYTEEDYKIMKDMECDAYYWTVLHRFV